MDGLSKLSDYDIFGYLAPGLVLLVVCDLTFGTTVFANGMTVTTGALVVIASYVIGHATAAGAAFFWDRILVRGLMGMPTEILMRKRVKGGFAWRKWFFSGFFDPLPTEVRKRVLSRAGFTEEEFDEAPNDNWGERVFARAWPIIKRDPVPYGRMESFLRLYGFCRNISFVAFVVALIFLIYPSASFGLPANSPVPALAALLISLVMFHRYLKFLRLYSFEVFSTYAEPALVAGGGPAGG